MLPPPEPLIQPLALNPSIAPTSELVPFPSTLLQQQALHCCLRLNPFCVQHHPHSCLASLEFLQQQACLCLVWELLSLRPVMAMLLVWIVEHLR